MYPTKPTSTAPFSVFQSELVTQSAARRAVTVACRVPETVCVPRIIELARLEPDMAAGTERLAAEIVENLRRNPTGSGVQDLVQEFSLSSQEGVALMCLAEALLRIPDQATRDAIIRDKISRGDWRSHLGRSSSIFVNAATWGLLISGKLVGTSSEAKLSSSLTRLIGRGGEPVIRKGVNLAMRMMGEQFVAGETINRALAHSKKLEAKGFRYSYDMLGEAATTAEDAKRYYESYEQAIHAIGAAAEGRGIYEGPGISIKLSALHPRYSRAQHSRMLKELLPRVRSLALLARRYDIGLNIDAEEAERLEISLDLLESLCFDNALKGWNGVGFVVQAYQKRCPFVIDFILDLARRSGHRIMVRLVKGAYWDTEIKRAQVDGLSDYPVYTRKIYTDIAYLACAKKLLGAADAVYPQFATHNAHTLAAIYHLAGPNYYSGQYEFQCLHGMGEDLYRQVTGLDQLNRPCRIYAPVGSHETLLAYLVRRLLENGANTSFVNRVADKSIPISELIADPVREAEKISPLGAPHERIPLPTNLFGAERQNSAGVDLSNELTLHEIYDALRDSARTSWMAIPMLGREYRGDRKAEQIRNPANCADVVGLVTDASSEDVEAALEDSVRGFEHWSSTPISERAACLNRAANMLEADMAKMMGLVIREAGKSLPNAISEIREAVDFLRYYAAQVEAEFSQSTHGPLGPVVCISPWNFPLAIFVGQVSAALAAGNTVIAKPAEQTPLVAAEAIRILRAAGVPASAVQLLPGDGGRVGAALVSDSRVRAVMFTGSTEVARLISKALARRLAPDGQPIPLIAETGGQNAMIVDSSALPEQVVVDVLQSAFDSAGQRCSALRILCLQSEIADRTLGMLLGAMRELSVGNPDRLSTDIGPVIDAEARESLEEHIAFMRSTGRRVTQLELTDACKAGTFVPPTIIEIEALDELPREVFGPVLHVLRFQRSGLEKLMQSIRATGYGLTLGVHSRIDETIRFVLEHAHVGNVYVNRNVVGAVVGVQPFGGEGLSGTGPKAGGPLYLRRLLSRKPSDLPSSITGMASSTDVGNRVFLELQGYLNSIGDSRIAAQCTQFVDRSLSDMTTVLPGPTGERNTYSLTARGTVLCVASTADGARTQLVAAIAAGNKVVLVGAPAEQVYHELPVSLRTLVSLGDMETSAADTVLHEGDTTGLLDLMAVIAKRNGPIIPVQSISSIAENRKARYVLDQLLAERTVSVNTTAAGGNANLMTLG
nr:trifunctional transcriptional regulator/proline dehydrogenase/L-glutamate gamma-semialdehyde dehydrogenase [Burkholderia cepacia]